MDPRTAEIIADLRRQAAYLAPREEHIWSCPGCWSWQLHVSDDVALQWSTKEFDDIVEAIIRDHVARECTAPQLVLALLKNRSGR
jgi:hypothetical protein